MGLVPFIAPRKVRSLSFLILQFSNAMQTLIVITLRGTAP